MTAGAPGKEERGPAAARLRAIRAALAASPWPRRISRLLAFAAGALLIVGPLQPWAFVSFAGLRLPLYGLFSPGGLAVVGGLLLLFLPSPGPVLLFAVAAGSWYATAVVPPQMLAGAHATLRIMDSWLDPLNQLLDRFHIAAIQVTDWNLPAARRVPAEGGCGPGVLITLWGAGLSAAAAVIAALAHPLRGYPPFASPAAPVVLRLRRPPASRVPAPGIASCGSVLNAARR